MSRHDGNPVVTGYSFLLRSLPGSQLRHPSQAQFLICIDLEGLCHIKDSQGNLEAPKGLFQLGPQVNVVPFVKLYKSFVIFMNWGNQTLQNPSLPQEFSYLSSGCGSGILCDDSFPGSRQHLHIFMLVTAKVGSFLLVELSLSN